MALCSFSADDAEASTNRVGLHTLEDDAVGSQIQQFGVDGFPIISPSGLDFVAHHSFLRQDILQVLSSLIGQPHLGLIKIYSQELPRDYAFRLHSASVDRTICLLVQLWSPDSIVCFYDSRSRNTEVDPVVSKERGLLATHKTHMNREGIPENIVKLKMGGLVLADSRMHFSVIKGYTIMLGFTTKAEVENWGKMELPYSKELQAKVKELQRGGVYINCSWLRTASPN